ncbi:YbbR-like domain-containing protein [Muricauda sp. CAU 1633]|uniref:CdaR family protein n=1 Tax=Allomuricauda sp. CAU 1633 TaxID=2816036 RepID=UPI001A905ACC|nr:YbbR-like domain-containing protein [Muricauda sp. CAU 1633]MBO0324212.1 YbbR-like domain-containing protein [Muricauda sp. CAU 1633]
MFKKVLQGLNQKKVKVFSLFLVCSFLAWFLSNLSETYESRANLTLNYRNLPDSLLLGKNSENVIETKLRTSGFQFLFYNFFKKRVDVDVSQVEYQNGQYILTDAALRKQIDVQLSQNISLLDLDRNRLVVDLYQVASKEIPIRANLGLQFQQNFIMDGVPQITPDHVMVKGPESEIDTLTEILTEPLQLTNLAADFSRDVALVFPKGLDNSIFSVKRVNVSGKVVKFSEKVFETSITVVNSPEGYQVKTFPNAVTVLCKATVERLKSISSSDFEVEADYAQLSGTNNNTLLLTITRKPENVYDVRLSEKTVNFVLEQQ